MSPSPFRIIDRKQLDGVRSIVTIAEHSATGAVLVHLDPREERENFFSICFRTPPVDNSGTPHILEHTVLCGSRKYPVKDPFMELVRSSMATFINALTYDDRTVYPVGSTDRRDFLNLVDVYMDAVFHPLLRKEFFQQEGFRLQVNGDGTLTGAGVVYNEMKGAYADPDSYMERETARALFPDSPYGMDSGGDPAAMETLTFQEYLEFYRTRYHPGNSCLFALTSIPFDRFAERMDTLLPDQPAASAGIAIKPQSRFTEPVKREIPVQGENGGCTVLSAWMVNGSGDPSESLAFSLLEDVLLDDDSSPVRKALLDSGLGTGLSTCGFDADPMQRTFVIGLKGVRHDNAEAVFRLIRTTLEELVRKGPEQTLVDGMLHRKELLLRYSGSGWPFAVMSLVNAAWAHGEDIMHALDLNNILNDLRKNLADEPQFLAELTEKWLLNNPHRADLVFKPQKDLLASMEIRSEARMKERMDGLSREELATLIREGEELERMLDTPDPAEALATIPRLHPSEIDVSVPKLFHSTEETGCGTLLSTSMGTSGLDYVDICMDMSGLGRELLPYLPLFTSALTRTGAGNLTHLEMADRELRWSSGLSASITSVTSSVCSTENCMPVLKLSGYCLARDLNRMLELMELRLFRHDLSKRDRLVSILRETCEGIRSSLIPRGDAFASLRARAGLTSGHMTAELFSGIPVLKRLEEPDADREQAAFRSIGEYIRNRAPRTLAWTGPKEQSDILAGWLVEHAPLDEPGSSVFPEPSESKATGILIPADTSFAAAAQPGLPLCDHRAVPGIVAIRMLSEGYLWDEIRARNGAYGAGASLAGGALVFSSYRDPDPAETLRCFQETARKCSSRLDLSRQSIEDSITASLKGLDPPLRPAGANGMALVRHFRGLDPGTVKEVLNRLLNVDREQIEEFSHWMASPEHTLRKCVMGNGDVMTRAGITDVVELKGGL